MRMLNYIAFQACWFAILFYDSYGLILFGLYLLLHFYLVYYLDNSRHLMLEFITISIVSLVGIAFDSVLLALGIYNIANSSYFPIWYLSLWPLLGTTFNHCFYPFLKLSIKYLAVIGAVSVPFIYYSVSQVKDSFYLGEPLYISLVIVGIVWAILLPAFIRMTVYLEDKILINNQSPTY